MSAVLARMMRGRRGDNDGPTAKVEDSPTYTNGPEEYEWFDAGAKSNYSKELRDLVLSCLQYEPTARPTNMAVRDAIQQHLSTNSITMESEPMDTDEDLYKEKMTFTGTMIEAAA